MISKIIRESVDYLGLKSNIYINSGITLFNLKKLRKDNKAFEFLNLTNIYKEKILDQNAKNYLLHPKIGRLPSKYAMFNFGDNSDIDAYINTLRTKIPKEEVEEALKNPTVIHTVICYRKIWDIHSTYQKGITTCAQRGDCSCKKYYDLWHSFANQTGYYEEIIKFTRTKNC